MLAQTSAFVTHGGMNSVSESLRVGVPMVMVPQMGEQEMVSRRVERLRLGVQRLLVETRFREQAARIGATLLSAGGTVAAAALVREFAGRVGEARLGPAGVIQRNRRASARDQPGSSGVLSVSRSLAVSSDSVRNELSGWRLEIVTLAVSESTTQYSRTPHRS